MDLDESPWRNIDATGSCWEYTGKSRRGGEGRNGAPKYAGVKYQGKTHSAHRLIYELLVGPIPDGLVLDHLCKNTICCNPDHLEPVTQSENCRRGATGYYFPQRPPKTHCPQGHELSGENVRTNRKGWRQCRICDNARALAYYYKKKELNGPR